MRNPAYNSLVVLLSLSLVLEPLQAFPFLSAAPEPPLRISSRYGDISDYFAPAGIRQESSLLVLIQDLHANAGVQRNIAHLLESLIRKQTVPEVMSEGGIGRGDISLFKGRSPRVIDELVEEAALDGIELAAIQSGEWIRLEGMENPVLYLRHIKAFRESRALRPLALVELRGLRHLLGGGASAELKRHLNHLELLISLKMTRAEWARYLQNRRLNPHSRPALSEAVAKSEDFYRLALERDEALAANALRHSARQKLSILVTGGFHTQGITERLRRQNRAYMVVSPRAVESGNDSAYERSLTDYLKAPQVSVRNWNALSVPRLPPSLREMGHFLIRRISGPAIRLRDVEKSTPHVLLTRGSSGALARRFFSGLAAGVAGIGILQYLGFLEGLPFFKSMSGNLLFSGSMLQVGFLPGTEASLWIGGADHRYELSGKIACPQDYALDVFKDGSGHEAWVVRVHGEARLVVRQTQTEYESFPLTPIQTSWDAQRHLEVLYNFIGLFREVAGVEIQTRDAVVIGREAGMGAALKSINLDKEKQRLGFTDRMDIYLLLAHLRGTVPPQRPHYTSPHYQDPLSFALNVSPKLSSAEAGIVRKLMGNPDLNLSLVVGTTPKAFWRSLQHSGLRRFPVERRDFNIDSKTGMVSICGKEIRIVKNLSDLSDRERSTLGIRTMVSTRYLTASEIESMSKALRSNGETAEESSLLNVISMQSSLKDHPGNGLYGHGIHANNAFKNLQTGELQLVSSLGRVPVLFIRRLLEIDPVLEDAVHSAQVIVHTSATNEVALLDNARQPGLLPNVLHGFQREFHRILKTLLADEKRVQERLWEPKLVYAPVQTGTEAEVVLEFGGAALWNIFGEKLGEMPREPNEWMRRLRPVMEIWIERHLSRIKDGKDLLFRVLDYPVVPSYARGSSDVLIGRSPVEGDTEESGEKRSSIQLEAAGDPLNPHIRLTVPLVFDRLMQDARQLETVLEDVAAVQNKNVYLKELPRDWHVSDYQQQFTIASLRRTLPPLSPSLPSFLELTKRPLNEGIIGAAGRTGSLRLREMANDLNVRPAALMGGQLVEELLRSWQVDSTHGPWRVNLEDMEVSGETYGKRRSNGQIGWIRINGGPQIPVLERPPKKAPTTVIQWGAFDVDFVWDATGKNTDPRKGLFGHHEASRNTPPGIPATGARYAVGLTQPIKIQVADGETKPSLDNPTIVFGINDERLAAYASEKLKNGLPVIFSNASCTTNAAVFLLLALFNGITGVRNILGLNDHVKIVPVGGFGITIHADTNTNSSGDAFENGSTKEASAINNIIPTETGLNSAIKELGVLQDLAKVIKATADRVPVDTGSHIVITKSFHLKGIRPEELERVRALTAQKDPDGQAGNAAEARIADHFVEVYQKMAEDPKLSDVVEHVSESDATTSASIVGSRAGSVLDSQGIKKMITVNVSDGEIYITVTLTGWYDNERGYSTQLARVSNLMAKIIDRYETEHPQGHAFYIPAFKTIVSTLRTRLSGAPAAFLAAPLAGLAYLLILPRYLVLLAFGLRNWRLMAAAATKAFHRGFYFAYRQANGHVRYASPPLEQPALWGSPRYWLQHHESQTSASKGFIFNFVHLFSSASLAARVRLQALPKSAA